MVRRFVVALAALSASCGGEPPPPVVAPTHVEDDGPRAPRPSNRGHTGDEVVAIVIGAPRDAEIAVAEDALAALVAGDRARLERLLAPKLALVGSPLRRSSRSRAAVLAIALNESRRKAIPPGMPLERLVRIDEIRAIPIDSFSHTELPEGVDEGDVLVRVPLTDEGRAAFRAILPGWDREGRLIVGAREPKIVKGL